MRRALEHHEANRNHELLQAYGALSMLQGEAAIDAAESAIVGMESEDYDFDRGGLRLDQRLRGGDRTEGVDMKDADYYALDHEQWVAWMKGRVQLSRLFDARVFSIGPTDGGDIRFERELRRVVLRSADPSGP